MINICNNIISVLLNDSTLTATVPKTSIMVGPVDINVEKQSEILMPQINIHPISEVVATVPRNTKETRIQIEVWSRNSEMEAQTIYERILTDLNFLSYDQGTSHIYWQRLGGVSSLYDSEMRLWQYASDFQFWSLN
ncbi:MAG: tail completion protein gp17 [Nitrospiria bacterium]